MLKLEVAKSRFPTVKDSLWNAGHDSVMGYFRPVSHFNKGKKSEFSDRVCFSAEKACKHLKEKISS